MIKRPESTAIFYYAYRPLLDDLRRFPDDGGFAVALYPDDRVVFTHCGVHQDFQCQMTYVVSSSVRTRYLKLLELADDWLGGVPERTFVPQNRVARFESILGFEGYPLLICQDIPILMRSQFMDPDGRAARKLCGILEDISDAFRLAGIGLYLDGYTIDSQLLSPIGTVYADDLKNTGSMAAF